MKMKRFLAGVLAAVMVAGATLASAAYTPFPDITDPRQAECAEFLRLMGVVNGVPGGSYHPEGTLSRAEFCKMAVVALDRAEEESAQRGRTIYLDVGPTHWARGYINLASAISLDGGTEGAGKTALVSGVGDGTFRPDRAITYGEAVTILCRVLGYGTGDVTSGGAWYEGYLAIGARTGLTDGLSRAGGDTITRGEAAILFYNLYFCKSKGSSETYLTKVGGKEAEGGVVLDVDATAEDGTAHCVKTTTGTYKTDRAFDTSLQGQTGKVLLDKDGRLLAFQAKEGTSQRGVSIRRAEALYFVTAEGEEIDVKSTAVVYRDGEATDWSAVWQELPNSKNSTTVVPAVMHFGSDGRLAYLYFPGQSAEESDVMVARSTPNGTANPFASMTGGSYTMYKNGVSATAADLRQYDVATWDKATRTLQVSDRKLTGIYENVSPSPSSPLKVWVMGKAFDVLPEARADLASFSIGERITLLFTADNQVAGAVSAATASAQAVGVATVSDKTATVTLLRSGIQVSGEFSGGAERYNNQLVSVSSSSKGSLSLQLLTGTAATGALNTAQRTLGNKTVSANVAVYDRVEKGELVAVDYDKLPASISASRIGFVSYDYAGRVDCMVLKDATGDAYRYGYLYNRTEERDAGSLGEQDSGKYTVRLLWVENGGTEGGAGTESEEYIYNSPVKNGAPGGVALTAGGKVAAVATLESLTHVGRDAFDTESMTVTVGGVAWPISEEVACYNKTTKTWYPSGKEGLKAARAYSDDLTLWYDRAESDGGRIRLIEVP